MNCLLSLSVLLGCNGSPVTRFSRIMTRLMSWPDGERYLRPLQSCVVSLLFFLVFTLLFSRTGGVPSHRNSLTHRFPRFPSRNLCSFIMLVVFSLSSTLQRTQPSFKLLFLQDWHNRKSFLQRLWTLVSRHFSSHSALSSYGLSASLDFWRVSVSLRSLAQALRSFPDTKAPWSSAMSPSLGRVPVTATTVNSNFFVMPLKNADLKTG